MYILVGMLVVGLICNLLVRPVNPKYFMSADELAQEKRVAHDRAAVAAVGSSGAGFHQSSTVAIALAWLAVGLPLAWGVYRTLLSASKFFH
jgi:hypothetical protein